MITPEQACISYAEAAEHIRQLTAFLSDTKCPNGREDTQEGFVGSCLDDFLEEAKHVDEEGIFQDRDECFAAMCETCKLKLKAIEDRREWRKKLGAAKRAVRRLGKKLGESVVSKEVA